MMGAAALCIASIVAMVAVPLIEGGVIWLLWGWYLVPLGIQRISFGSIVAIGFIVTILTAHLSPYPHDEMPKVIERMVVNGLFLPGVALLFGWALK